MRSLSVPVKPPRGNETEGKECQVSGKFFRVSNRVPAEYKPDAEPVWCIPVVMDMVTAAVLGDTFVTCQYTNLTC
jgi:hypothetical protein